jgi:EmrB/QacA subfamily drug resistance transporter
MALFKKKNKEAEDLVPVPKYIMTAAWMIVLGAIMPMLDSTMVNIAINHFSDIFHAPLDMIQWTITGYVLALAVAVPVSGWAVQKFNGKWLMIGSNIGFLLGSMLCGLTNPAWGIGPMVAFRIIQGIAAGFIMSLAVTLLMDIAGPEFKGRVMATIGLPTVLGPVLGPVLGALILQVCPDAWGWRVLFFVNVPVGILAVIMMIRKLQNFEPSNKAAKFDLVGIALLGAASCTLVYGIAEAAKDKSFSDFNVLLYIGIGILILVAYGIYAAVRKDDAILPISLFKRKNFTGASIGIFLSGIAANGPMLLLPLLFQNVFGFDVIFAGLMLIPQGLGMLVSRPLVGKMTDRLGARLVVIISLIFSIAGTIPFIFIDKNSSLILISVVLFIRGFGIGGVQIPLMTDGYTGMVGKEIAQSSVGSRIFQNIGGAFGSAIIATVVAVSIPAAHIGAAAQNLSHDQIVTDLTNAYHDGFIVALAVCILLLLPALLLSNKAQVAAAKVAGAKQPAPVQAADAEAEEDARDDAQVYIE